MGLASKLLEVQKNIPTLGFDAKNPHFKNSYVTLGKVLDTIKPLLQAQGVLLMQPLNNIVPGNIPALTTMFTDIETGETLDFTTPLVLEKETPQGFGSAVTYHKRYALLSFFGLVGEEDDDAEATTSTRGLPKTTQALAGGYSQTF